MPSKETYNYFLEQGYPVDQCAYNRYDSLESNEDLEMLFNVLSSVKDKNLNPAKITANTLVANPDFEKIADSGYKDYFYETTLETYKRYPKHNKSFEIFKQGITAKVVMPQFHGREHLNVKRWMRSLQKRDKAMVEAFNHRMFSIHQSFDPANRNEFMDAFDYDNHADAEYIKTVAVEGLDIFNKIWGFKSGSFIACCYKWHSSLEPILAENGVKYIQGLAIQGEPIAEPGTLRYKKIYHYQGEKNRNGQYYLTRNAFFEPSQDHTFDWVADCLQRIDIAFRWNKPAIICSHRVNFIGSIDTMNRDRNLKLLKELLTKILTKWPDVEFISSDEFDTIQK